ncbi:MAG: hypothetical protein PVF43_09830 [Candidatus Eiseniibacteriota bacterium]|jgi:hypothetical protein
MDRPRSGSRVAVLAFGLIVLGVSGLAATGARADEDEGWALNYDQVRDVARRAVRDLLTEFPVPVPGTPIELRFANPHETSWMVKELVGEALAERGARVIADSLPGAVELELNVVELGLRYTGARRSFLFGPKRIERLAVATLAGSVLDPGDGTLAWRGEGRARAIDEVPAGKLSILEGQSYPFTRPVLPPSNIGHVLEPIIVSGIVVGLVFLFVSNRN